MAGLGKFIGGVVSGGLVAGLTLVVASQISEPRAVTGVADPVTTTSGGVGNPQPPVAENALAPSAPVAAESPQTAQAEVPDAAPAKDVPTPLPSPEPAPPPADPADAVAPEPPVLPEVAAVPDVQPTLPATDVPAQSAPVSADAVPAPAAEQVASLTAQPAVPPVPPLADGAPMGAELPPPPPLTAEEEASLADPSQLLLPAEVAPDDPSVPVAPAAEDSATSAPEPATPNTATPDAAQVPAAEMAEPPSPAETATSESDGIISPVIPAPAAETAEVEPPAAAPSQGAASSTLAPDSGLDKDGPSTLPATPRLIAANEGSLIDRDQTLQTAEPAAPAAEAGALPVVALDDQPALDRFAAPFENTDQKPLFGILLVDDGDATLDRQSVASLPFPVSIVVDPSSPDAAAHAALYRAGGKEVVMLATGIPDGATAADVEQTFQANAAALPEAVAVIDGETAAFQDDRPLSTQIVPILAAQGRGLLTWDRGLNAADQVARREGLPTAMIFRQIDAEGEEVPVMRRYLDRAAFKAAQEGKAIVIGTIRPQTIAAILEWTIEGRASTVALAPASALLKAP